MLGVRGNCPRRTRHVADEEDGPAEQEESRLSWVGDGE